MRRRYDVIVIGAGQAGLAMGRELAMQGREFLILDAARELGSAWRGRWDSLRLFTPARYSGLPGLPFPGDPDHYPTRDDVVAYFEAYARAFALPVALDEPVRALRQVSRARFLVETDHAGYLARQVVVATGAFQSPWIPPLAATVPPGITQLHSASYRNPGQLPDGPVLVVGGGNTGVQLAAELATTRATTLAVGAALPRLPVRFLGRSIFTWLDRTGAMEVRTDSYVGKRAARNILIGDSPARIAREHGVTLAGRAVGAAGDGVRTADGRVIAPRTILWATGFRPAWPWLQVPVLTPDGQPVQRRGVTAVPGLYFLGLPWLSSRGSSLLGWVGNDAAYLAGVIAGTPDRGGARPRRPLRPGPCESPRPSAATPGTPPPRRRRRGRTPARSRARPGWQ